MRLQGSFDNSKTYSKQRKRKMLLIKVVYMVPGIAAYGTSSDVGPKLSKGKSTSHIKGMQSGKKEERTI